jgi:hypothetical protein
MSGRLFACILLVMSLTVIPQYAIAEEQHAVSRPIPGHKVMALLYKFHASQPAINSYGEISEAIAKASTEDPLFPLVVEGSEMTACILVSLAWHESRFLPTIVGDGGRSFGLYQIQPPTARVDSKLLTLPRDASFVAIDLIRTSIAHTVKAKRDWRHALAWYAASSEEGSRHPVVVSQSHSRMELAAKLFAEFFGAQGKTLDRLLLQKQSGT